MDNHSPKGVHIWNCGTLEEQLFPASSLYKIKTCVMKKRGMFPMNEMDFKFSQIFIFLTNIKF